MIFRAIEFAAAAHKGQFKKGTRIPYIVHPLNAARVLIEAGCSDALVTAAVLHDVLEDTPATYDQLMAAFGVEVADLVVSVSEPDKAASWEDRKEHTIRSLESSREQTLLVAVADKLDNIRSVRDDLALRGEVTWKRFRRGRDHQKWYYQSLSNIFVRRLITEPGLSLARLLAAEVEAVFGTADGPDPL